MTQLLKLSLASDSMAHYHFPLNLTLFYYDRILSKIFWPPYLFHSMELELQKVKNKNTASIQTVTVSFQGCVTYANKS